MVTFFVKKGGGRVLVVLAASLTVAAAEKAREEVPATPGSKADKSGYSLFRPAPREMLRDLSADRPDQTESPCTLDAGDFDNGNERVYARLHYVTDATFPSRQRVGEAQKVRTRVTERDS